MQIARGYWKAGKNRVSPTLKIGLNIGLGVQGWTERPQLDRERRAGAARRKVESEWPQMLKKTARR
jgi:hypothetical protein